MRSPFLIWLLIIGYCLLTPCCKQHGKVPYNLIPQDSMRKILMDVLIAEAAVPEKNMRPDSFKIQAQKYYLAVFAKYGISKERFFKSMKYYTRHPDLFERTLTPVIDSLNTLEGNTHRP